MTSKALAEATRVVVDCTHTSHAHGTATVLGACVACIVRALTRQADAPIEPEHCRVPESRGLHVGYPRQGGRAPDGGMPPRTP